MRHCTLNITLVANYTLPTWSDPGEFARRNRRHIAAFVLTPR